MDGSNRVPPSAQRVLFVASEVYPLAKSGGLADVCGALPATLARLGLDIRIMLPGYPMALDLTRSKHEVPCNLPEGRLVSGQLPNSGLPVLLFDCPRLFARQGGLYHDPEGHDWSDNAWRFGMFCRAAAAVALGNTALPWRPQIVHANDWHTGLLPALLRYSHEPPPRTIFTIHNLAFQGNFPLAVFAELGLPRDSLSPAGLEFYGSGSFLKAGLVYSDRLTTVSPNYAREILTPEHGCGLDGLLRTREPHLVGILNGVDDGVWNPAKDDALPCRYDADTLDGKATCKHDLCRELGLANSDAALVLYANRLTHQKMADVVLEAIDQLVANGNHVAVLGDGDPGLERAFAARAAAHPGRVAVRLGYHERLAHRMTAGADLSLTPSRFEPCGLTTMYAMRYGALPVTRPVGGLKDTVQDAVTNDNGCEGSGFFFSEETPDGLARCVYRATDWYRRRAAWTELQKCAMRRDFRWDASARQYYKLYNEILVTAR